jgi:hypothetical protein
MGTVCQAVEYWCGGFAIDAGRVSRVPEESSIIYSVIAVTIVTPKMFV